MGVGLITNLDIDGLHTEPLGERDVQRVRAAQVGRITRSIASLFFRGRSAEADTGGPEVEDGSLDSDYTKQCSHDTISRGKSGAAASHAIGSGSLAEPRAGPASLYKDRDRLRRRSRPYRRSDRGGRSTLPQT